jgi:molecular chaperone DnaK
VEAAIADVKKALEGTDTGAIERAAENLTQASHKLAEAMYKSAGAGAEGAAPGQQAGGEPEGNSGDAMDADFTVVDDDDDKK